MILSVHKKTIQLQSNQRGCNKPVCPMKATSPTLGECIVLFFWDMEKIRTLLVLVNPYGTCKALKIWSQHPGLNIFGQDTRCGILQKSKSILRLSGMRLPKRRRCISGSQYKSDGLPGIAHVIILERRTFTKCNLNLLEKDRF